MQTAFFLKAPSLGKLRLSIYEDYDDQFERFPLGKNLFQCAVILTKMETLTLVAREADTSLHNGCPIEGIP